MKFRKDTPVFVSLLLIIFFFFVFFRTYKYLDRIYVESDNSRDAQVVTYAADHRIIPPVGQFSSAGPFFYGPLWYWFLVLLSFIPLGKLNLWYSMTLLSNVYLLLLYIIGKKIGGKWLGLVVISLYAVSPAQIDTSLSIWNPTAVPYLSLLLLFFFTVYLASYLSRYVYIVFFLLGTAISIHLQSLLLLPFSIITLVVRRLAIKQLILTSVSFILPFLPLILFDLKFNFFNFRNFYHYLTVGQYNIWVPNRWLTYLKDYWPQVWGNIVGGNYSIGILCISLYVFSLLFLGNLTKKKYIYFLSLIFLLEITLFRYFRGERFVYYSYFSYPMVTLLSAWSIYTLILKNRIIGLTIFFIIFINSVISSINNFSRDYLKYTAINEVKEDIYSKQFNSTFSIYSCPSTKGNLPGHPLAYFMYRDHRNDENGIKIGVCMSRKLGKPVWQNLEKKDLQGDPQNWFEKNTKKIFEETSFWWIDAPPKI